MKHFSRLCLTIAVLVAFVVAASAQIDLSQQIPFDPNVKMGKLANGLTYYIRHNGKPEKRVELRLVVNAGSILEDDNQQGLAHFMEHMNFNGTKHFPKNELVSYLQSIGVQFGADLNAYTSFDETVYILPVPTDKPGLVDKGLQILEDWSHEALLDSVEIEKERGVVIEEWRLGRGADERMMKQTLPVQYEGSKYAERLPIGKKEILDHFPDEAIKRFYKDWYRPDLEAVIVVGDIDVNDMEQKINQYFGNIPMPASPRKRESFPVPDQNKILSVVAKDKETDFPSVEVMFKKDPLPETTVGDYCRYMNEQLFTGMLNNRFRELTRKANPPFVQAQAFYGNTFARTKDAFQLFANCSDTGMSRTLYSLMQEDKRVLQYGFTQSEFDRQKKQMLSSYDKTFSEREKEESGNYVDEYVNHFLLNEPTPGIEWEYDFAKQYLPSAKLEDVNKLAVQWMTKSNMVVTLNAPEKEGIKIPSADEVNNIIASADMATVEPYTEKALAKELMDASKLKPGKVITSKKDEALGTTTLTLSNGVTVILKPTNFKNDEITVRAFSKGGSSLVKDDDYYSALLATTIVAQSGVGDFSASDLSKVLQGRNTSVSMNISDYSEGLSGSTTPKETETLLQLIHLYFTQPRKDPDAYLSLITRIKQVYKNLPSNPQIYYSSEFQRLMTKNNLRGGALPKPEDFDKVNLDRAEQIYKDRFANAGGFTFLFVGSFDETTIKPLLEKYLGSLPSTGKKENFKDLGIRPPTGKIDKTIIKGTEPQSQVNIVFTNPAVYNSKDAYALRSLGEALEIKLLEQLREEKGGVYTISANGDMEKIPYQYSSFTITFPCAPENVDSLTQAAFAELKKILKNGVTTEDMEKVKEQQKRKLEVDIKQNQFWMGNLFSSYYNGENPRNILSRQKEIDGLTSAMIQNAAKKYININNYIRAVLKPEKVQENKQPKPF